jgi:hypothetical protein
MACSVQQNGTRCSFQQSHPRICNTCPHFCGTLCWDFHIRKSTGSPGGGWLTGIRTQCPSQWPAPQSDIGGPCGPLDPAGSTEGWTHIRETSRRASSWSRLSSCRMMSRGVFCFKLVNPGWLIIRSYWLMDIPLCATPCSTSWMQQLHLLLIKLTKLSPTSDLRNVSFPCLQPSPSACHSWFLLTILDVSSATFPSLGNFKQPLWHSVITPYLRFLPRALNHHLQFSCYFPIGARRGVLWNFPKGARAVSVAESCHQHPTASSASHVLFLCFSVQVPTPWSLRTKNTSFSSLFSPALTYHHQLPRYLHSLVVSSFYL